MMCDMETMKQQYQKIILFCIVIIAIVFINSCAVLPPKQSTAYDDIHSTLQESVRIDQGKMKKPSGLPRAVSEALLPPMDTKGSPESRFSQRRFNMIADNMPAKVF